MQKIRECEVIVKIPFENFEIKRCGIEQLDSILEMQEKIISQLPSVDILRENSPDMFLRCLSAPNYTLGAWYNGKFVGVSILYFPDDDYEDLCVMIEKFNANGMNAANYKLCMVLPEFRGNSLQYYLEQELEKYAKDHGVEILCATASPKNSYSINNMLKLGYVYDHTIHKYGYVRNLYYKLLV